MEELEMFHGWICHQQSLEITPLLSQYRRQDADPQQSRIASLRNHAFVSVDSGKCLTMPPCVQQHVSVPGNLRAM